MTRIYVNQVVVLYIYRFAIQLLSLYEMMSDLLSSTTRFVHVSCKSYNMLFIIGRVSKGTQGDPRLGLSSRLKSHPRLKLSPSHVFVS